MNFFKSLIVLAFIGLQVIRAEDSVPETSEANESSNEIEMDGSPVDSSTESSESPIDGSATEETTETVHLLLEEVDPNSQSTDELAADETTTETIELFTSEYNGFDAEETESSFSCYGRSFGQYADVSKECRVFHLCYPFFNQSSDELLYQRITFLCDDESVFDQKRFICVDNSTIEHKCTDSESLYMTSNQEYLIRVFSQSVSPIDEMKGRMEEETVKQEAQPSNPGWFNWLYNH